MDWLHDITTTLAREHGVEPSTLTLDPATRRALLDVARVASHTSGDRKNAPLLCYVLGIATAHGVPLEQAIARINEVAAS